MSILSILLLADVFFILQSYPYPEGLTREPYFGLAPASFGGFLDVSGLTFSFDPTKPVGERVQDVYVGDEPLDLSRQYKLTANDFLFAGGDDYEMLTGLPKIGEFGTCEEILADYLNEVGMGGIDIGRITLLKEVPIPEERPDGEDIYAAEEREAA